MASHAKSSGNLCFLIRYHQTYGVKLSNHPRKSLQRPLVLVQAAVIHAPRKIALRNARRSISRPSLVRISQKFVELCTLWFSIDPPICGKITQQMARESAVFCYERRKSWRPGFDVVSCHKFTNRYARAAGDREIQRYFGNVPRGDSAQI